MNMLSPGQHSLAVVACLILAAAANARTGNVKLVSAFSIFPNDQIDDTANLQLLVNGLVNGDTIEFDLPGTYELSLPVPCILGPILLIDHKDNITIKAVAGVKIELTGYDRSVTATPYPSVLEVGNCNGFTLAGADGNNPLVIGLRPATIGSSSNEGLPFLQ